MNNMHGFKAIGGINMLQTNSADERTRRKSTLSKGRYNNKMSKQTEGRSI